MENTKTKWFRLIALWVCIAAVVVFLAIMPALAKQKPQTDGPKASILSGTAQYGQLTTELIGGGALAEEAAVAVTVPEGVKLTSLLTYDGVAVTKGTPIATVDRVTVMAAISRTRQALDELDKQIEQAGSAHSRETLTAQAGGVVKILHAKAGDSAGRVMLEHGALAVLSLDNLLAVEIFTDSDLRAGTAVHVTFQDGKTVTGRVAKNLGNHMTVTVEDRSYTLGDTVEVTTTNDVYLGSDKLYIYSPWKVIAHTGTVADIAVRVGDRLAAGQTLMTLDDVGYSPAFRQLVDRRQEYEALMLQLVQMYQSETVNAPCDGIVSGVGGDATRVAQITPQEKMTLAIAVDEGDIKALQLGMTARVEINSLGGEAHTATVTAIGNTGVNHGGSSKYTVELTMDRTARMLAGMKATAAIVLTTDDHVLTVPADALVEDGNRTLVYTGCDEKTQTLLNPVAVTVGNADGESVQILEGLTEGQTYYYAYYDTLTYSPAPEFR